jgi:hypothetical protein
MHTMWIPKLSAAVIMLGLGAAAVHGAASADAAPADTDSARSSSSNSSESNSSSSVSGSDSSSPKSSGVEGDSTSKPDRDDAEDSSQDTDTDTGTDTGDVSHDEDSPQDEPEASEEPGDDAPETSTSSPEREREPAQEGAEGSTVADPVVPETTDNTTPTRSAAAAQNDAARTDAVRNDAAQNDAAQNDAAQNDAVQSDAAQNDAARTDVVQTSVFQPGGIQTGAVQPVVTRPAEPAPLDPLIAVMSQLLAAVGVKPGVNADPAAPPVPQSGTVVLNEIRRWVSQLLISTAPTASPRWVSQSETGVITGTLDAVDAAGNPLRYKVTEQPTNGTVVVDADGTFRFTPNAALVGFGGIDGFTVDVSNGVRSLFVRDAAGVHLSLWNAAPISVPVNLILRPDNAIGAVANVNRFWVINTSSKRLMWRGFIENDGATGPYPGVYIDPGQEVYFDMASSIGSRKSFVTTFSEDGVFTSFAYGIYATQSGWGVQDGSCWGGSCYVKDGWAFFLQDAPNTNISISAATDPYGAKNTLVSMCREGSRAVCDFTPTRQEKAWGTPFELTQVRNGGTGPITQEISESRTASQTDNIEISAEASSKLSDLLNLKIAAKYGHSWTESKTFGYKLTVPVPGLSAVSIWARNPVDRVYGTFTIQMGNTTWTINDVYFDTPDAGRIPAMEIKPLTSASVARQA